MVIPKRTERNQRFSVLRSVDCLPQCGFVRQPRVAARAATLGGDVLDSVNPERVLQWIDRQSLHPAGFRNVEELPRTAPRNPFRVHSFPHFATQGSCCAATLGCHTQPLRGTAANDLCVTVRALPWAGMTCAGRTRPGRTRLLCIATLLFGLACTTSAAAQQPVEQKPATKATAAQPAQPAKKPLARPQRAQQHAPAAAPSVPAGEAPAPAGIPATLEEALTRAMDNNPEIITAKAKLQLAEAELNAAQLEITKKVINLWQELRRLRDTIALVKRQADYATEAYKSGQLNPLDLTKAQTPLIDAQAKAAQIENDLHYLIGRRALSAGSGRVSQAANSHGGIAGTRSPELPRGPLVEKIREALLKPAELDVTEMAVKDVVQTLSDLHRVIMVIDRKAFDDAGIQHDMPITLNLKGITFAALLQAFEDQNSELRFVVRDYGILLTTPEQAKAAGYYPLLDLARQSSGVGVLGQPRTYHIGDLLAPPPPPPGAQQSIRPTGP
jgi:hypothetical protein